MREYIKKDLETPSGVIANSSSAIGLWIDLKACSANIMLEVNKDIQTRIDGKAILDTRNVSVSSIDTMTIYQLVHDTVVAAILADPQYIGGTLEYAEDPVLEV